MVKLGEKVKDKFNGCAQVGIQSGELDEKIGKPQDLVLLERQWHVLNTYWVWLDEQRLIDDSPAKSGGPQPNPPQS